MISSICHLELFVFYCRIDTRTRVVPKQGEPKDREFHTVDDYTRTGVTNKNQQLFVNAD